MRKQEASCLSFFGYVMELCTSLRSVAEKTFCCLSGGPQLWSVASATLQQHCGIVLQCHPFRHDPEDICVDYYCPRRGQDSWALAAVSALVRSANHILLASLNGVVCLQKLHSAVMRKIAHLHACKQQMFLKSHGLCPHGMSQ